MHRVPTISTPPFSTWSSHLTSMKEEQCVLVRDFTKRIKALVVYLCGLNKLKQKLMINLEKNNITFEEY